MDNFLKIREENRLLLETIRGSHLYGLQTETSDLDTYGVFVGDKDWFYGINYDKRLMVTSDKNDDSWSEIGKYIGELSRSNPDALVALFTPKDKILTYNSIIEPLFSIRDQLLTKECFKPFSSYAVEQIKKAKGLNKAMNLDPKEVKDRKTILDFCIVPVGCGSWTLSKWIRDKNIDPNKCGLTRIPNSVELYVLYYDETGERNFRGLLLEDSTQLRMSSIPKDIADKPLISFQYNSGAYSQHCTDYKRYHDWVKNRNKERYQLNTGHNFDAKNMCHCVRLMTMAREIAKGEGMNLDRTNIDREWLLSIKNHEVNYDELMKYVSSIESDMQKEFEKSKLPNKPDVNLLNKLLINIRNEFYGK